jgi:excisionase family DNA binding protein
VSEGSALLNYADAALLLGMRVATLYSLVSRRQIPHVRISRRLVRFSRQELERWIEQRSVGSSEAGEIRHAG